MYRAYQKIKRRKSKCINVGHVKIGGDAPISVQTMTNTITADTKSTLKQIKRNIRVYFMHCLKYLQSYFLHLLKSYFIH